MVSLALGTPVLPDLANLSVAIRERLAAVPDLALRINHEDDQPVVMHDLSALRRRRARSWPATAWQLDEHQADISCHAPSHNRLVFY